MPFLIKCTFVISGQKSCILSALSFEWEMLINSWKNLTSESKGRFWVWGHWKGTFTFWMHISLKSKGRIWSEGKKSKQTHMFEKWISLKLLLVCDLKWVFWWVIVSDSWILQPPEKIYSDGCDIDGFATYKDTFKVHFAFKCHIWICVNFCRQFARFLILFW